LLIELQTDFKSLKLLIDQSSALNKRKNDQGDLKNEILSTRALPQSISIENYSKIGIELLYYYRIGQFLEKILEIISTENNEIFEIHPNNVVTGLIKGSGIANLFINEGGDFASKSARNFYVKSRRVYKVYKGFPSPLAQIYCAGRVSADKLLKINNEGIFENFVKNIDEEVKRNYDHYNYQSDSLQLFEDEFKVKVVSNDIIIDVIQYIKNPSLPIKTQITPVKIFDKLNKRGVGYS
jgi:hypothetical protein